MENEDNVTRGEQPYPRERDSSDRVTPKEREREETVNIRLTPEQTVENSLYYYKGYHDAVRTFFTVAIYGLCALLFLGYLNRESK
jgi:hypothetical protein